MASSPALSNLLRVLNAELSPRAESEVIVTNRRIATEGDDDLVNLGILLGENRELGHAIFLDIETTGLTAGAGTLVALVGLAWVEGNEVIVRQYILHDPAVESAMLDAVSDDLQGARTVVTFNGKRFDAPILLGRYLLHRRRDPFPDHHLDLLHPARRIWSRRLRGTSLLTLESRVLGVVRPLDIPGEEIPARFFDFVRGDCAAMLPVIEHNRQDLVTLILLARRIARLVGPRPPQGVAPADLVGLGRLCEAVGQVTLARRSYEAALGAASRSDRAEAIYRLATIHLREGNLPESIELLEAAASYSDPVSLLAAIDLAKIYEHRQRDPRSALLHTRQALRLAAELPDSTKLRVFAELERRVQRLTRKLGRAEGLPFQAAAPGVQWPPVDSLG